MMQGYFGFTINPVQAESLKDVLAAFGTGIIDGFGNPGNEGPVHFTHEVGEEGVTILTDGAIVVPKHLATGRLIQRGAPVAREGTVGALVEEVMEEPSP